MPFAATQIALEIVILSKVKQTNKKRQIYHLYVESNKKKKYTNEHMNNQKQTHILREQTEFTGWKGWSKEGVNSLGLTCTHCYI